MTVPLKVWIEQEGRLLRLRLARPKANLVDAEMIAALADAFAVHLSNTEIRAVLLDAEGPGEVLASALASQGTAAPLVTPAHGPMRMDGRAIWNFAVRIIPETVWSLCRTAGITPDDLA